MEADADAPLIEMSLGDGETVTVEGEGGETVTINQNNYADTDSGFSITGKVVNNAGELSDASVDHVSPYDGGIGVNGTSDGPDGQNCLPDW